MMFTIMRTSWLNLKRDIVALGLTFVLPIIFFTIFATIFSSMGGGGASDDDDNGPTGLLAAVVDEDITEITARLIDALDEQDALRIRRLQPDESPWTRQAAIDAVREGDLALAYIVAEDFSELFGQLGGDVPVIELVHDAANPMARPTAEGILQAAAMTAAPDVLMTSGMAQLEAAGGAMTPMQRTLMAQIAPALRGEAPFPGEETGELSGDGGGGGFGGFVTVQAFDPREQDAAAGGSTFSIVSYSAAGIGVMFLLFSMAGAGGALLEEEEQGTLERLLSSNIGMLRLLLGNWIFLSIVGVLQVTLMFVWGAFVFGIDLWTLKTLTGFMVCTIPTAMAAGAFGMVLATMCRTRAQLSGLSTIIILIMSALGGSMIPRFVSDIFETTSLYTFNGWALNAYQEVFWRSSADESLGVMLGDLVLPVGVLVGATLAMLFAARLFARRWEAS